MRGVVLGIGVMAGCGFTHGVNPADPTPDGAGPTGTTPAECHAGANDTSLRLCLDFEESPLTAVAHDLSPSHDDAALTSVTPTTRAGQGAVMLTAQSSIVVPPSPLLALTGAFTVEMWIDMAAPPPHDQRAYPIDSTAFYGLTVDDQGELGCFAGDRSIGTSVRVTSSAWLHAACTYDGHTLQVFVDGDAVACSHTDAQPGMAPVATQVDWGTSEVSTTCTSSPARSPMASYVRTPAGPVAGPATRTSLTHLSVAQRPIHLYGERAAV